MRIGILLTMLMFITSCGTAEQAPKDEFNLVLIGTTDIHGMIFPYDFLTQKETDHSMAQVATILNTLKKDPTNKVVYVDTGDYYQGQPIIYYYNFMHKGDNLGASALNYLNATTTAVGNHDIEVGQEVYDALVPQMDFPYLAANILRKDNNEPYFEAYTTTNIDGLKIAFIGMITPQVPQWLPEVLWKDMYFEDIPTSSEKWIKIIEEKESPDLIIGLFHSGLGTADAPYMAENSALYTALNVEGYDVIFKGHDHESSLTNVKSPSGKNVLVLGANDAVRTLAKLVIPVKKNVDTWELGEFQAEILDIKGQNIPADPAFMKFFAKDFELAKKELNIDIGEMSETITSRDSIFGPSKFVDLIHQLQFDITKTELNQIVDVSFSAPLSVDASLEKGKIYFSDLFSLYRYENWLYVMNLSGQEIKDFLEYNYNNWITTMTGPESYMIAYKYDANNKIMKNERYNTFETKDRFYNYDSAAGINYTVDLQKPMGSRVQITTLSNGTAFDMNKTYKVAINSYRANGGGGHLTTGSKIPKDELVDRIIATTDKDLRFYLGNSIKESKIVTPVLLNNWKFIPEDWATEAKKREYAMWFPDSVTN